MPIDAPKDIEATSQNESQNEVSIDRVVEAPASSDSAGEDPFQFFTEWGSEEDTEAFKDL